MVYSILVALKNQTINLVSADSAQNGPSHLYNQQYYNKSVRPKNILKDLPFIITLSYWFVRFTQKSFYLLNKNCKNILLLGMISSNLYWASFLWNEKYKYFFTGIYASVHVRRNEGKILAGYVREGSGKVV